MLFYRRSSEPKAIPMQVDRVRWLGPLSLTAYPIGCIIRLLAPDENGLAQALGFCLVLVALFAFAGVISTGVQRITSEERKQLDSLELELRQSAYAMAYHIFGALVLVALLYCQVAIDSAEKLGLWLPSTSEHWNAIMWGALLCIFIIPSVGLAWRMPKEEP